MSEPFGRRRFQLPEPAPARPAAAAAPRLALRAPEPDPELEAWKAARAKGLWLRLLTPWILLLGGPAGFLLPEGPGQVVGLAASGLGTWIIWKARARRA